MKKITSFDEGPTPANIKKWYEEYPKVELPGKHGKSESDVLDLKAEAKKCLDSESTAYHLKQSKSSRNSDYSWLKTALSKGTTSDRVAAGIVLIQNSPKHNLNHLTTLISQVKVAKHNQSGMIITALRDLFLTDLLHPDSKLLKFEEQDLDQLDSFNQSFEVDEKALKTRPTLSRNKLLGIWYFEDQLKEIYEKFVHSLSTIANDTVDTNREKAVSVMNDLLMGNAEQEQKLLDLIVNKIGDPASKVASKAVFSLTKLLNEHPNMKLIVLREVEKLLFRSNLAQRAQYFAICLLTQFVLSKGDNDVATTLIDVYFAFFKACLKRGEPDSRMMAAILSGVNRAYRFADVNSTKLNEHIDSVYKVVHLGSFNVSLNALSLLFQVVGKDPKQSGRFYSAFYRKLLDSQIGIANKSAMFLNLLFRVLRNDDSVLRLHAFIKRVLQVSLYFPANMTCATLYVISQILRSKKHKVLSRSMRPTSNSENDKEVTDVEDKPVEKKVKSKRKGSNIVLSNVVLEPVGDESIQEVKPENVEVKEEMKATRYDPFSRNPMHCGANLSFYAELEALSKHFHPSVALFANMIMQGKPIEYTGDPLQDLTLIRFLDRYVFKNPKKLESKKVAKKNDPLAQRASYTPKGIRTIPVDSLAYLNEREDRIPVDELFLYQYMHKRKELRGVKVKTEDEEDEEDDDDSTSVNSEEFDDMLDRLSKNKGLEELDVAGDFHPAAKKSKGNDAGEDDADDDEEDEDDLEDDDEEISDSEDEASDMEDGESDEELQDLDDLDLEGIDDDLSDIEFDEQAEIFEEPSSKKRKQTKSTGNAGKKPKSALDDKTFVSAEEFAVMLENQGRSKFKHGASSSYSDRDGASVKQLDWETERNQRISGFKKGSQKGKSFKNFKSKKSFTKHQRKK